MLLSSIACLPLYCRTSNKNKRDRRKNPQLISKNLDCSCTTSRTSFEKGKEKKRRRPKSSVLQLRHTNSNMPQFTEQEFFGGAIRGVVPQGWIDSRLVYNSPMHEFPILFLQSNLIQSQNIPIKKNPTNTQPQYSPRGPRPPRALALTNHTLQPNHRNQPARPASRSSIHLRRARPPAANHRPGQRQRSIRNDRNSRPSRCPVPPARSLRRR